MVVAIVLVAAALLCAAAHGKQFSAALVPRHPVKLPGKYLAADYDHTNYDGPTPFVTDSVAPHYSFLSLSPLQKLENADSSVTAAGKDQKSTQHNSSNSTTPANRTATVLATLNTLAGSLDVPASMQYNYGTGVATVVANGDGAYATPIDSTSYTVHNVSVITQLYNVGPVSISLTGTYVLTNTHMILTDGVPVTIAIAGYTYTAVPQNTSQWVPDGSLVLNALSSIQCVDTQLSYTVAGTNNVFYARLAYLYLALPLVMHAGTLTNFETAAWSNTGNIAIRGGCTLTFDAGATIHFYGDGQQTVASSSQSTLYLLPQYMSYLGTGGTLTLPSGAQSSYPAAELQPYDPSNMWPVSLLDGSMSSCTPGASVTHGFFSITIVNGCFTLDQTGRVNLPRLQSYTFSMSANLNSFTTTNLQGQAAWTPDGQFYALGHAEVTDNIGTYIGENGVYLTAIGQFNWYGSFTTISKTFTMSFVVPDSSSATSQLNTSYLGLPSGTAVTCSGNTLSLDQGGYTSKLGAATLNPNGQFTLTGLSGVYIRLLGQSVWTGATDTLTVPMGTTITTFTPESTTYRVSYLLPFDVTITRTGLLISNSTNVLFGYITNAAYIIVQPALLTTLNLGQYTITIPQNGQSYTTPATNQVQIYGLNDNSSITNNADGTYTLVDVYLAFGAQVIGAVALYGTSTLSTVTGLITIPQNTSTFFTHSTQTFLFTPQGATTFAIDGAVLMGAGTTVASKICSIPITLVSGGFTAQNDITVQLFSGQTYFGAQLTSVTLAKWHTNSTVELSGATVVTVNSAVLSFTSTNSYLHPEGFLSPMAASSTYQATGGSITLPDGTQKQYGGAILTIENNNGRMRLDLNTGSVFLKTGDVVRLSAQEYASFGGDATLDASGTVTVTNNAVPVTVYTASTHYSATMQDQPLTWIPDNSCTVAAQGQFYNDVVLIPFANGIYAEPVGIIHFYGQCTYGRNGANYVVTSPNGSDSSLQLTNTFIIPVNGTMQHGINLLTFNTGGSISDQGVVSLNAGTIVSLYQSATVALVLNSALVYDPVYDRVLLPLSSTISTIVLPSVTPVNTYTNTTDAISISRCGTLQLQNAPQTLLSYVDESAAFVQPTTITPLSFTVNNVDVSLPNQYSYSIASSTVTITPNVTGFVVSAFGGYIFYDSILTTSQCSATLPAGPFFINSQGIATLPWYYAPYTVANLTTRSFELDMTQGTATLYPDMGLDFQTSGTVIYSTSTNHPMTMAGGGFINPTQDGVYIYPKYQLNSMVVSALQYGIIQGNRMVLFNGAWTTLTYNDASVTFYANGVTSVVDFNNLIPLTMQVSMVSSKSSVYPPGAFPFTNYNTSVNVPQYVGVPTGTFNTGSLGLEFPTGQIYIASNDNKAIFECPSPTSSIVFQLSGTLISNSGSGSISFNFVTQGAYSWSGTASTPFFYWYAVGVFSHVGSISLSQGVLSNMQSANPAILSTNSQLYLMLDGTAVAFGTVQYLPASDNVTIVNSNSFLSVAIAQPNSLTISVTPGSAVSSPLCNSQVSASFGGSLNHFDFTPADYSIITFGSLAPPVTATIPSRATLDLTTCQFSIAPLSSVSMQLNSNYSIVNLSAWSLLDAGVGTVVNSATTSVAGSADVLVQLPNGTEWLGSQGVSVLAVGDHVQTINAQTGSVIDTYPAVQQSTQLVQAALSYGFVITYGGVITPSSSATPTTYIDVNGLFKSIPVSGDTLTLGSGSIVLPNGATYVAAQSSLVVTANPGPLDITFNKDGTIVCSNCIFTSSAYGYPVVISASSSFTIYPPTGSIVLQTGPLDISVDGVLFSISQESDWTRILGDGSVLLSVGAQVDVSQNTVALGNNGGFLNTKLKGLQLFEQQSAGSFHLGAVDTALYVPSGNIEFTGDCNVTDSNGVAIQFTGTGSVTNLTPGDTLTLPVTYSVRTIEGQLTLPDTTTLTLPVSTVSITSTSQSVYTSNQFVLPSGLSTATATQGAAIGNVDGVKTFSGDGIESIVFSAVSDVGLVTNNVSLIVHASNTNYWASNGYYSVPSFGAIQLDEVLVSFSDWAYVQAVASTVLYRNGIYQSGSTVFQYVLPFNQYGVLSGVTKQLMLQATSIVSTVTCTYTLSSVGYLSSAGLSTDPGALFNFTYNGTRGSAVLPKNSVILFTDCSATTPPLGTVVVTMQTTLQATFTTGATITSSGLFTANGGYNYSVSVAPGMYILVPVASIWQPDNGYLNVPQNTQLQVYSGNSLTSTFNVVVAVILRPDGTVYSASTNALLGHVNAQGFFVYVLPAQISVSATTVNVPQLSMAVDLPAVTLSFTASAQDASLVALVSSFTLANVSVSNGDGGIDISGQASMTDTGIVVLGASSALQTLRYASKQYSLIVSAASSWLSNGTAVILGGTLTDDQSTSSINLNVGALVTAPLGVVLLFPGSQYAGVTLASFGSATWDSAAPYVQLSGAISLTLVNSSIANYNDSASILYPDGRISLSPGVTFSVASASSTLVALIDTQTEYLQQLEATWDTATRNAYNQFEQSELVFSIALNLGGIAQSSNGNVSLPSGTQVPLAYNPQVSVVYPANCTWIAATGEILVPSGQTIATVSSTGAIIATYTTPVAVLVSTTGTIASASSGAIIAAILPSGLVNTHPGPNPRPLPIPQTCRDTRRQLYVVVSRGGYAKASAACAAYGLKPAILDTSSIVPATALLTSCGGVWKRVYIGGWGSTTSTDAQCMALWNGPTYGGSGAVAVPASCTLSVPILCQGRLTLQ